MNDQQLSETFQNILGTFEEDAAKCHQLFDLLNSGNFHGMNLQEMDDLHDCILAAQSSSEQLRTQMKKELPASIDKEFLLMALSWQRATVLDSVVEQMEAAFKDVASSPETTPHPSMNKCVFIFRERLHH